jgi:hypothetical protein
MVHEALASLCLTQFGFFEELDLVVPPDTILWHPAYYSRSRRITRAAANPASVVR